MPSSGRTDSTKRPAGARRTTAAAGDAPAGAARTLCRAGRPHPHGRGGTAFAGHAAVAAGRDADGVFAPPDPSGERGLNEPLSGRVRDEPVQAVPDRWNARPRTMRGDRTPAAACARAPGPEPHAGDPAPPARPALPPDPRGPCQTRQASLGSWVTRWGQPGISPRSGSALPPGDPRLLRFRLESANHHGPAIDPGRNGPHGRGMRRLFAMRRARALARNRVTALLHEATTSTPPALPPRAPVPQRGPEGPASAKTRLPPSSPSCARSPTDDRPETLRPSHEADNAGPPVSMNTAPVPMPQATLRTAQSVHPPQGPDGVNPPAQDLQRQSQVVDPQARSPCLTVAGLIMARKLAASLSQRVALRRNRLRLL